MFFSNNMHTNTPIQYLGIKCYMFKCCIGVRVCVCVGGGDFPKSHKTPCLPSMLSPLCSPSRSSSSPSNSTGIPYTLQSTKETHNDNAVVMKHNSATQLARSKQKYQSVISFIQICHIYLLRGHCMHYPVFSIH